MSAEYITKLYRENMRKIEVGAKVARNKTVWTIIERKFRETSVELTLRSGRREITLTGVMMCISGPCLADVGLVSVSNAPEQREMQFAAEAVHE
jgi:hypothetical protein